MEMNLMESGLRISKNLVKLYSIGVNIEVLIQEKFKNKSPMVLESFNAMNFNIKVILRMEKCKGLGKLNTLMEIVFKAPGLIVSQ